MWSNKKKNNLFTCVLCWSAGFVIALYLGPYTRVVHASFQGGIRA